MDFGQIQAIRRVVRRLHVGLHPPQRDDLTEILFAAQDALNHEDPSFRPRDHQGRPGGLLLLNPHLYTIVVPDLHARTGFLDALLDWSWEGATLLEGLARNKVQVLCVGDGFHSEARGAERWKLAWEECLGGFAIHDHMDAEMRESLGLMSMVMILKAAFPQNFHFLKGNHENIQNRDSGGDKPFGKYACEGLMVREWFLRFYGEELLHDWGEFEQSLPLLGVGERFLVSHAEPRNFHSRDEVIEYRDDANLVYDFTWTGNGEAEDGSVEAMLHHYLGTDSAKGLYFGGHRPIAGRFGLRAEGRYVQIHNPDQRIIAVLAPGADPDPQNDVLDLDEW